MDCHQFESLKCQVYLQHFLYPLMYSISRKFLFFLFFGRPVPQDLHIRFTKRHPHADKPKLMSLSCYKTSCSYYLTSYLTIQAVLIAGKFRSSHSALRLHGEGIQEGLICDTLVSLNSLMSRSLGFWCLKIFGLMLLNIQGEKNSSRYLVLKIPNPTASQCGQVQY